MSEGEQVRYRRAVERVGFAQVCHSITLDDELSDGAVRLYLLLLKYAQDKGECWPGVARLARNLNKSERTMARYLSELAGRGLITREQRLNTSAITWIEDVGAVYNPSLTKMAETGAKSPVPDKNGRDQSLPNLAGKEEQEEEPKRNGGGGSTREQAHTLLTGFGVAQAVADRLARERDAGQVRGWIEYARAADGLRDPVGLVVRRLLDGEPVPERQSHERGDDRQRYITGQYAEYIQS